MREKRKLEEIRSRLKKKNNKLKQLIEKSLEKNLVESKHGFNRMIARHKKEMHKILIESKKMVDHKVERIKQKIRRIKHIIKKTESKLKSINDHAMDDDLLNFKNELEARIKDKFDEIEKIKNKQETIFNRGLAEVKTKCRDIIEENEKTINKL